MFQRLKNKIRGITGDAQAQPPEKLNGTSTLQSPEQFKAVNGHYPPIKHVQGGSGTVEIHAPAKAKIKADIGMGGEPLTAQGIEYLRNRESQFAPVEPEEEFDWDAFFNRMNDTAAAAAEREQNKPWEDDCDYDYQP
ncbi:hypothetical protein FF011L_06300 [Roseimaritima multifibrata]|uniref:Uncharacterized protein n=1 Tax=Roseimaritima multifibrata TaxID=1930274 RepID=A0A517MAJ5_9BACT|nr:hypothetical protein [Roseimaritima multifibrata]QDS91894.1 hypothetical protein FF011L_06300 [Roseimaritima multifibrata]